MTGDIFKNTVSAKGQLMDTQFVSFHENPKAKIRVLFVGNSITRHGVLESIGWYKDCGMAASCIEKDFVHLVIKGIEERYGEVEYCIAQAAEWERKFWTDGEVLSQFAPARDFAADIVIIRIGENIDVEKMPKYDFAEHFAYMLKFFFAQAKIKVVSDLFWSYLPIDEAIKMVAQKEGYSFVSLGELGSRADCKALGEYEHQGVALHPNDRGMRGIADLILKAIDEEKSKKKM